MDQVKQQENSYGCNSRKIPMDKEQQWKIPMDQVQQRYVSYTSYVSYVSYIFRSLMNFLKSFKVA